MIELHPFAGLGGDNHGWLDAKHHFSFANYRDPKRMNWGNLRVWNDDTIAPHSGFPPHPHRDMEIITYVREGAITHEDNLGNKGRTEAGDVQVMSAGTGITHAALSELPVTPKDIKMSSVVPSQVISARSSATAAPGWSGTYAPQPQAHAGLATLNSSPPTNSASTTATHRTLPIATRETSSGRSYLRWGVTRALQPFWPPARSGAAARTRPPA